MSPIANVAVDSELMTFVNDPQSDSTCGLSPMLAWTWPVLSDYNNLPSTQPMWPATSGPATNLTSVQIAVTTITNRIPSRSSLPSGGTISDVSAVVLDTTMLFCFAMLYNQLAQFQGIPNLNSQDPILGLCSAAVAAASAPSVIPSPDPSTGITTLQSSLTSAANAVVAYVASLSSSDAAIPFATSLATLVPRMFTSYWTLSYFCSFGDGRMTGTSFYDQRYAPLAVTSAFDGWLQYINSSANVPHMQDISSWLADAHSTVSSTTEGPASLSSMYSSNKSSVQSASDGVTTLQATNAQFERRRSSVGALSENLKESQKQTDLAFATLVVWAATLSTSLAVAGFLVQQRNYPMVLTLIISIITLLAVDTLGRAVASTADFTD